MVQEAHAAARPPHIMLVEDDPDTAALISECLADHFGMGRSCICHCATVAQAVLAEVNAVDLVLTDMNLPDGTGLDVLNHLLQRRPDMPVVLVTAEGILENALKAISQGAYDYIVKAGDYLFAIPIVVEKNLAIWRTKRENQQLQEQLRQSYEQVRIKNRQLEEMVNKLETMASTDPLTGIANRRAFGQAMARSFAEAQRYHHDLACIMIDLDGFKQLNDTLGHQRGDQLLQAAAKVLEANCRRSDIAGRFGGDEFIVLLTQTELATAQQVAQRIAQEFRTSADQLVNDPALAGKIAMSMGLATLRHSQPASMENLIAHADHALYAAKQAGKTTYKVYNPGTTKPAVPGVPTAPGIPTDAVATTAGNTAAK